MQRYTSPVLKGVDDFKYIGLQQEKFVLVWMYKYLMVVNYMTWREYIRGDQYINTGL